MSEPCLCTTCFCGHSLCSHKAIYTGSVAGILSLLVSNPDFLKTKQNQPCLECKCAAFAEVLN